MSAIVRRLVARRVIGACSRWRSSRSPAFGVFRITPQGFLPVRGPGRLLRRDAAARGASLNRTEAMVAQVENIIRPIPGRAGRALGGRPQLHRLRRRVEPGLLRHPAEAVRGAHRPRAKRRRDHRAAAAAAWRRSRAPSSSRSTCRRSSASAAPAGSSMCSKRLQGQSPTRHRGGACAASWSPPTSSPSLPACSAPSPPTRRRSISTSTATRRRCWASRSATSSTRCNRRSAASTSTTSTCSAAPGRSTCRPRRAFRNAIDDIYRIYVREQQRRRWCRSGRSRRRGWCRGRRR